MTENLGCSIVGQRCDGPVYTMLSKPQRGDECSHGNFVFLSVELKLGRQMRSLEEAGGFLCVLDVM